MAWPYRQDLWSGPLHETQEAYARVAQAIAAFEPVTMIAPPRGGRISLYFPWQSGI
jgi:agmatine deiminase